MNELHTSYKNLYKETSKSDKALINKYRCLALKKTFICDHQSENSLGFLTLHNFLRHQNAPFYFYSSQCLMWFIHASNDVPANLNPALNKLECGDFSRFLSLMAQHFTEVGRNIREIQSSLNALQTRVASLEVERQEFRQAVEDSANATKMDKNDLSVTIKRLYQQVELLLKDNTTSYLGLQSNKDDINDLITELERTNGEIETFRNDRLSRENGSAAQLETMRIFVAEIAENVKEFTSDCRSEIVDIRTDLNRIQSGLQKLSRQTVTDIKLSPVPEFSQLYQGEGWFDTVPYVITEVSNFNKDQYPDSVKRRKLLKLVDGTWTDLDSG